MKLADNPFVLQKRRLIAAALLLGLVLSGCDQPTQSQMHHFVPEVATVTVSTQSIVLTTELPGRTSSYLIAEIRPHKVDFVIMALDVIPDPLIAGRLHRKVS